MVNYIVGSQLHVQRRICPCVPFSGPSISFQSLTYTYALWPPSRINIAFRKVFTQSAKVSRSFGLSTELGTRSSFQFCVFIWRPKSSESSHSLAHLHHRVFQFLQGLVSPFWTRCTLWELSLFVSDRSLVPSSITLILHFSTTAQLKHQIVSC